MPQVARLIEGAVAALERDRDASRRYLMRAKSLLHAGLPHLKASVTQPVQGQLPQWRVNVVTDYIERHLADRINVETLARLVTLSPCHFTRSFKLTVGLAPKQYVMQRRIERAKQLMRDSGRALAAVAVACGMCDQSHFCRSFRRTVGLSPSDWRRLNMTDPAKTAGAGVAHEAAFFIGAALVDTE